MPIYCVVMFDVKQESLANANVRIGLSTQQQCMYEGPSLAKKSTANQRKEHNVLTWKVHSVAKDEGIATLFLMHRA